MNRHARSAMVLVVVAVIGGGVSMGAPAPVAAATGDNRPGRLRFEMAETKFNLGKFEEAAVDYQAAYEAEPLPAFLFNIGQCYRNLGDYERAQFYFRRYVELDPRSANRPAADDLIAEMDRLAEGQRTAAPPPALASLPAAVSGARAEDERAHAFAPVVTRKDDTTAARPPFYRRPWFWVGGAAVVAAAVAAGVLITRDDRQPSLRPIDAR
jgi:tetratricopeptide (TPR) repeat protein